MSINEIVITKDEAEAIIIELKSYSWYCERNGLGHADIDDLIQILETKIEDQHGN